jgi:hypothetical protein
MLITKIEMHQIYKKQNSNLKVKKKDKNAAIE